MLVGTKPDQEQRRKVRKGEAIKLATELGGSQALLCPHPPSIPSLCFFMGRAGTQKSAGAAFPRGTFPVVLSSFLATIAITPPCLSVFLWGGSWEGSKV